MPHWLRDFSVSAADCRIGLLRAGDSYIAQREFLLKMQDYLSNWMFMHESAASKYLVLIMR